MIRGLVIISAAIIGIIYPQQAEMTSWASDFVRFHDITYADRQDQSGRALTSADLGTEYSRVRFRILGTSCEYDPTPARCRSGNAVALSLPIGTPVYTIKGYRPTFRLAAGWPGRRGLVRKGAAASWNNLLLEVTHGDTVK